MSDLAKRLAALTPEQRALFELRMKQRSQRAAPSQVIPRRDPAATTVQSIDQERLWFMYQLEPQSAAYNVGFAFRLRGKLDIKTLERSLNAIVERHEILRTTYATVNGQAIQLIAPTWSFAPRLVNLRELPATARESEAQRLLTVEAQGIFDLAAAPPLRLLLLRLADEEHVLLTTMHHIATDWWSFNVLYGALFRLYSALVASPDRDTAQIAEQALPPLPIQFADFAIWQREWLQGEVLQAQLDYWQQQLSNAVPLELPTDRPRPTFQTFGGARHALALPHDLSAALAALAQREGVTLFMLLLASFKLVLYRYTQQEDLVVGSPIANRSRAEIEPLIGFFVNTLVLRTDLGGNPSFRDLMQRVRQVCLQAYAHQDMPFAQLVRELNVERDTSRMPLVQVGFLIVGDTPSHTATGLAIESVEFDPGVSLFELSLALRERADGLSGFFEYNTDLFDAATIERMAGHWLTALESIAVAPEQPIAQVPLLTTVEIEQLRGWNATAAPYPADRCIPDLFAEQVARDPDALALEDETQRLTFAELDRRSNRLAWHLRGLGVVVETRVGLWLPRSVDAIVALLAILKAGGAYVPLDPTYPQERLQFMARDAAVAAIVTVSTINQPISAAPRICLDALDLDRYPDSPPPVALTPDNLVYVAYTSGSTGRPKGVLGTQRGVINRLHWMWNAYPFATNERCCQKTALSFLDSVWEIFGPLLRGLPVYVIADDVVKDPVALARTLAEQQITRIVLVPSLLRAMLDAQPDLQRRLPRLKYWTASGEALSLDLARRFADLMPDATLLNLYGSSEVAADATWLDLAQFPAVDAVPIGRAIDNMTAHVLDSRLRPVPIGVPGEIYVGGVGLARGYHAQPALTAARFLPDPFAPTPGSRLYRTGDRGRWRTDGTLVYLGRTDTQVKLRGFRIELGEIEAALRAHAAVREAVVLLREERLVAYVVAHQALRTENREPGKNREPRTWNQDEGENGSGRPKGTPVLGAAELRQFVAERLPAYMLPSAFVMLDELPLTPNGKVDRKALPEPDLALGDEREAESAARSQVAELLATIWVSVLGVERVGLHTNFFELGGHSLLATRVISQVRAAFQVELPVVSLFESPTVAALAQRIEAALQTRQPLAIPPIQPTGADRAPLSFTQQRLWTIDQHDRGNPVFNIPTAVRLRGKLDMAALEQSLNAITRRHGALRTFFAESEGQPVQIVAPTMTIPLPIVDLRSLPEPQREAEVRRLTAEDVQRRFDLFHGPLLRCTVLHVSESEYVLLLTIHHIISDGWSVGVLIRELATLYAAVVETGSPKLDLPPLPVQFVDYAIWQRQWLQGETVEWLAGYWRQQLAQAPANLPLPTDYPRPDARTFEGAHQSLRLAEDLSQALRTLSRQESCTLFMTLLAAFKLLLWRVTGQSDIVVGSPSAGRTLAETENLIGLFINTLPMRTRLSPDLTFQELLAQVRKTTIGAYSHQYLPLDMVLDSLDLPHDPRYTPLFQVIFNMLNVPDLRVDLPDLTVEAVPPGNPGSKFDFTIYVQDTQTAIQFDLIYNTNLFTAERMAAMLAQFRDLLRTIAADPTLELRRLL